jgi:hypothetical protein
MNITCPANKNFIDLAKSIKEWSNQDINKNYFNDPVEAAFKLVESEFNGISLKWLQHNPELTAGQVGSFKARLRELTNNIRRGSVENNYAELFFRPGSGFGKKDPVIGTLLRKMQSSGFQFRANDLRDRTLMKSLLDSLSQESKIRSTSMIDGLKLKAAQKKLDNLDEIYRERLNDWANKVPGSERKVQQIKQEIDTLIATSELKVYDDMLNLIEGKKREEGGKVIWESGIPKLLQDKYNNLNKKDKKKIDEGRILRLTDQDLAKLKMPDGSNITNDMYSAIKTYTNLMDGLYNTLKLGVRQILNTRKLKMERDGHSTSLIESTLEKLETKLMPKYQEGFFPHYTRDLNASIMEGLMPHFERLQNTTNYSKRGPKDIDAILKDINSFVDGHTIGRSEDYDYSRNFINSISNYIEDVNRFNFSAYMDGHTVDALTSVERIFKSKGDAKGYAQSLVSFIDDLHMAANGNNDMSPNTRAMMKSLLGFEFISKLGFNPRGAARNFTQRLLDYVHWGPVQVHRTNEYLEKLPFERGDSEYYIEKALRESGLLFEEASPEFTQSGLDSPASAFKQRIFNETTGKYEIISKTKGEWIADKIQIAAGKSSVIHRMAENANRKHTFKVGFAQMHRWLDNASVRNAIAKERSETDQGKKRIAEGKEVLTTAEFRRIIRNQAKNYAINMVVMNHFDYADYAKGKASRTKLGRFMLQFQHYSFEFFERNLDILREAKHDIATGNTLESLKFFVPGTGKSQAQGLEKAYRMAMAYFLVPALVSYGFGVNVGNIVEHDTAERIKQWFTYFTSEDDDEIAAAFYGKGPLLGTFGGPLLSDIIDIGIMLDLIDLDDDSLLTLIAGMEEHDPSTSTELGSKLRILNTFLGRAYERHYPAFRSGNIGFAFQQELALYPTAEARKRERKRRKLEKKKKKQQARQIPVGINQALMALQQKEEQLI